MKDKEQKKNFAFVQAKISFKELSESKQGHMMAITAYHQLGDISREKPDLGFVHGDDGQNWVGSWISGYGFFHVKFPKKTTRKLTKKEKEYWNSRHLQIASQPPTKIKIKD